MISIVCAAYNCSDYLGEAIESVQRQTYKEWELIIIDDCSTDHTLELAQKYAGQDERIIILDNKKNRGPAQTRNRGIKKAKGTFLTFIDGDDVWLDDFLSTSIAFATENDYTFTFASYKRCDESLKPLYNDFIVPSKVDYEGLLKTCSISCLTAFINIDKIGKRYMPDFEKRQDYGLWLSILKDVDYAYGIEKPLAIYRIRKGSVSRNKWQALWYVWKVYRESENMGFFKSLKLIIVYAINGLLKYYL